MFSAQSQSPRASFSEKALVFSVSFIANAVKTCRSVQCDEEGFLFLVLVLCVIQEKLIPGIWKIL